MNQYIKLLAALLALTASAISTAQELHTFSNGEVADAEKINENFQYLLNSGGGCSATQDGSSVVITCADGSSGVLASAGTVVSFADGAIGELIEEFNVGQIIVTDSNDVVLGPYIGEGQAGFLRLQVSEDPILILELFAGESGVIFSSSAQIQAIYYDKLDCQGAPFSSERTAAEVVAGFGLTPNDVLYIEASSLQYQKKLTKSLYLFGNCVNEDNVLSVAYLLREYEPAAEILNAVGPLKLEQLP